MNGTQGEVLGYLVASSTMVMSCHNWCGSRYWRLYQPGHGVYGPAYDRREIEPMVDARWLAVVYARNERTFFRASSQGEEAMAAAGVKAYDGPVECWMMQPKGNSDELAAMRTER